MAVSVDRGVSWVSHQITKTNGTRVLPWVVAGDEGRAAFTWYDTGSEGRSDELENANWSVQAAITTNALAEEPGFLITPILDYAHYGTIRTTGTAGTADRDLGDFFTCDIDSYGRMIATFGVDGADGPNARLSAVYWSQQLQGPFLLEDTGPEAIFVNTTRYLTVQVDASRSFDRNGGGIVEYLWDWGDGTNSTGVKTEHTYLASGDYKITLKVVNELNMRATATSHISARSEPGGPGGLCYIVIPAGLIAVGVVAFYFIRRKRRRNVMVVEEL
jgi:hypothetical protein